MILSEFWDEFQSRFLFQTYPHKPSYREIEHKKFMILKMNDLTVYTRKP